MTIANALTPRDWGLIIKALRHMQQDWERLPLLAPNTKAERSNAVMELSNLIARIKKLTLFDLEIPIHINDL